MEAESPSDSALHYCSRCTEVIVSAVNDLTRAERIDNGNLVGRLEKESSVSGSRQGRLQQR